jgi:hypothetical protein
MKKDTIIRILISVGIVGVLAALWGKQSDLAYNVSQQRDILLGRYTIDHMVTLVILTPILLYVLWGFLRKPKPKDAATRKKDAFITVTLILSVVFSLVFADVAMRVLKRQHYVRDGSSYHRRPNQVFKGVYHDRPQAAFGYPKKAEGYPDVSYTLSVDSQGFRNLEEYAECDWLVVGDSFAEGSQVSDEHNWPVLLAQAREKKLYNLGMSGGSPVTYLDTLVKFGLERKPELLIYLLYEGNDFRDSNFRAHKLEDQRKDPVFDRIFKASPLRRLLKDSLLRWLAPIGAKRFYGDPACNDPSHPMYPVAWLPLQVPAKTGHFYAFDLKRLLQHLISEADFQQTQACTESFRLLGEARQVCDEYGIRLVVVYVPDKPHILMDEVTAQVPAEQLHAFLALKEKDLPVVDELAEVLNQTVDVRETVIRRFCEEQAIEFIGLTGPLRRATKDGVQTYFTYDQHWTPDGHRVVADFLAETIK